MDLRFPRPLSPGDLIAVTAPSSGVPARLHPRLDLALDALRRRGWRVVEGDCLRQQRHGASAPPEQRAAELMRFLLDDEVAAVLPPWGGERAIELLPRLDFQALAAARPKWFAGFSDLSTLQLPLATVAGWASLHGPNLMELAAAELNGTTAALWRVLEAAPGSMLEQASSAHFQRESADWALDPAAGLNASEPTRWLRLDGQCAPLRLQGRLIGGCLDTIARLAGTRYGDVPRFVRDCGSDGALLFLENCEMQPFELLRALHSLRLHGWFEGLNGVLIGRHAPADATGDVRLLDALHSAFDGLPCPVLHGLDIGHLPPQWSLVQGALAALELHFDAAGTGHGLIRQHLR